MGCAISGIAGAVGDKNNPFWGKALPLILIVSMSEFTRHPQMFEGVTGAAAVGGGSQSEACDGLLRPLGVCSSTQQLNLHRAFEISSHYVLDWEKIHARLWADAPISFF